MRTNANEGAAQGGLARSGRLVRDAGACTPRRRRRDRLSRHRARPAGVATDAGLGDRETPRAAAARAAGRRAGVRRFPRVGDAVSDGQHAPAVLVLVHGRRHRLRRDRRFPGVHRQPEHGRRQPRRQLRRRPGRRLVQGHRGSPARLGRPARERRVDGELRRARGGAKRHGRHRRARRRCRGNPAAARVLRLDRGAQLRAEGDRALGARPGGAAQDPGGCRVPLRRSRARACDRGGSRGRARSPAA